MDSPQQNLKNLTLSNKIADPTNWKWRDEDKAMWKPAREELQDFRDEWYGNESTSLLDPQSTFLAFDPRKSKSETNIVRRPYLAAFDTIWSKAMVRRGIRKGVILVDQPGVDAALFEDMTPFGSYLLVRLLQMKQVVLFSPTGGYFHLFYHDGVYERAASDLPGLPDPVSWSSGVFIWSLFHMWRMEEPPSFMTASHASFPVQIAPPDRAYFRVWRKESYPFMTGLPVWTYEELAQALQHQCGYESLMSLLRQACHQLSSGDKRWSDILWSFNGARGCLEDQIIPENIQPTSPDDAMQYILDTTIAYTGYNAHEVFHGVLGHETITRHTNCPFLFSFSDLESAAFSLAYFQSVSNAQCDEILAITPSIPAHGALTWVDAEWNVDFTSDWIARKVIQDMGITDETDILRNIVRIERRPETQRLAARFLEPFVHRCIAGTTGTSWPLMQMMPENDDDDAPRFRLPSAEPTAAAVRLAKIKREVISLSSVSNLASCLKDNTYYIPKDPSFPLFDAFTVELDHVHRSAVLWVFQIITSRMNGGSFMGYKKVRDIISILKDDLRTGESPLKKFKTSDHEVDDGTPSVEVRYILAVPKRKKFCARFLEDRKRSQKSSAMDLENFTRQFPNRWRQDRQKHDHCGNVYCIEVPLHV